MKIMDLSGSWSYRTDYDDCGITKEYFKDSFKTHGFLLPGSACGNGIGRKREYYDEPTKEALRAPRERYEYLAPLWLQRELDVPESFEGKYIRLFLERVNIASRLWLDGERIGRQIIGLSAPHVYNLTGRLTPGKHVITLQIDNRDLLNIGTMASGYSIDTQGCWNGIIGRMELQCEELPHLEGIQVYPGEDGIDVRLVETNTVYSPFVRQDARLELSVIDPEGRKLKTKQFSHQLFNSRQIEYFHYEMEDIRYWDEFDPALYTLKVKYFCEAIADEKTVVFGMRTVKTQNRRILLNGRPIALRGTTDCAIYPLTGYPPMDIDTWRRNFKILKSYGLNHVRFHAWCPPENAFCAADELGLYVSVEMPLWLNRDVCALELGEDDLHREYFSGEALRISKAYGNHPCFIMFSNGNENMGDFELLEDIILQIKACDPRRIYTLTTNFDHPVLPCEDYLCAYEAGGCKVRMQNLHDLAAESTCFDYSDAVRAVPIPVISFEVGQYCVYPDVDIMEKYTGNMLPTNFDIIKKEMQKKGIYPKLREYIMASGALAVKLYKEEIEAALRTKSLGGFELLSLCDYTGQGTATVGILDVFLRSKGLITPEQFRQFCSPVVPLFKAKRIFSSDETLEGELDLYDHGPNKIESPKFDLKIYNEGGLFYQTATTLRKISIPLNAIKKSSRLRVELTVNGYTNSWNIYVFVQSPAPDDIRLIRTKKELDGILKTGGRAIVTGDCIKAPMEGSFIPVFWSPVHFPTKKPCGLIIDNSHPVFQGFPTDKYPDYQWKTLLDHSRSWDISPLGDGFKSIVETVPNFVDNTPGSPLFEARTGKAALLFCGFDLDIPDLAVSQLKACILNYVGSAAFHPENILEEKVLAGMLK